MPVGKIGLLLAIAASAIAGPPGFETRYVALGPSSSTVAVAANPADGSIFIVTGARLVKTDADGNMVAVFDFNLGASSAAAVDPQGNLLVVGVTSALAAFPATAQLVANLAGGSAAFVVRIDSGLTRILSAVLIGGSSAGGSDALAVTADAVGNVYLAGETSQLDYPVTPGAYEAGPASYNGDSVVLPIYSFVTKLSPDLGRILYSTYYGSGDTGGTFSASNIVHAIVVDATGAATIGGSSNAGTLSTSGEFTPGTYPFIARFSPDGKSLDASTDFGRRWAYGENQSVLALALDSSGNIWEAGTWIVTKNTNGLLITTEDANVAKLDSSLNVLYGSFVGGTATTSGGLASASGIQIDPQGNTWITGVSDGTATPYVAKLASDGSLLSLLQTPVGGVAMAQGANGSIIVLGSPDSFLLSNSTAQGGPFVVTSSADNVSSGVVAPGELVSLYGSSIGPQTPLGGVLSVGVFSSSVGGYQVLFNGIPAPLLYLGQNQINTVVPEEMAFLAAGGVAPPTATLKVVGPNGTINLPSVFVAPSRPRIFGTNEIIKFFGPAYFATALNEDGTLNSSSNPAVSGSIVTIWATGLGYENAVDGSIIQQPVPGGPAVSMGPLEVLYAADAPDAILGLTQVNFRALSAPSVGEFAIQTINASSNDFYLWVKAQ